MKNRKKLLWLALCVSIVILSILVTMSFVQTMANQRDIRCRQCHNELNRMLDSGLLVFDDNEYHISELSLDEIESLNRRLSPWMCEPCVISISYAMKNHLHPEHAAWRGLFEY